MGHLGVWSYAFFLVHVPVAIVLLSFISEPTSTVLGLALVLLHLVLAWSISALIYRRFEEPLRRRLTRSAGRGSLV
jgi:peptidoglycan/LPS O-acetylase OafA/YrhL